MAGRLMSAGADRFRLAHNGDINVTPFVDIMLVLLIIFMVALPPAVVSLNLNLPPAQATATPVEPIYVSLQPDGKLFLGETPTSLATLGADLAAKLGARATEQQIYVRAERGVRYGAFLAVVNRLQMDGYLKVGLVNEEL